jgi:hypothetical protein
LLQASEQAARIDDDWQSLNEADMRVTLHRRGDAHDDVAGHQTVSVQDDHAFIMAAEPFDPFADIAGLARGVVAAVPVKDLPAAGALQQSEELRLLVNPDVWIGGVAQNIEIEMGGLAALDHGFIGRL